MSTMKAKNSPKVFVSVSIALFIGMNIHLRAQAQINGQFSLLCPNKEYVYWYDLSSQAEGCNEASWSIVNGVETNRWTDKGIANVKLFWNNKPTGKLSVEGRNYSSPSSCSIKKLTKTSG